VRAARVLTEGDDALTWISGAPDWWAPGQAPCAWPAARSQCRGQKWTPWRRTRPRSGGPRYDRPPAHRAWSSAGRCRRCGASPASEWTDRRSGRLPACADNVAAGQQSWRAGEASVILWEAAEEQRPLEITMANQGGRKVGRSRWPARSPHPDVAISGRDRDAGAAAGSRHSSSSPRDARGERCDRASHARSSRDLEWHWRQTGRRQFDGASRRRGDRPARAAQGRAASVVSQTAPRGFAPAVGH